MSVKTNYLYNVAYQILSLILPLVTAPYLSRVLGAEGLGQYSYAQSVANYFVLFAMLGVNNYGNRSIARVRGNRRKLSETFCSIWYLQALLSCTLFVVYCIYCFRISKNSIPAIAMMPWAISSLFDVNWLFFGLEQFKLTVSRNFVVKIVTFFLTFVLVRGEYAVVAYCALMSLSMLVSAIVLWPFVRREIDFYPPNRAEIIKHVKPNLVLFLPIIAISFYTVLDKIMLGHITNMEEVGVFENSYKVASMPFTLIAALGTVMLPRTTNLLASGRENDVIAGIAPSMWFALLLSSAFSFGVMAITPEFVPVFFGPGFEGCKIAMPLIVAEMPFMAWANVIRTQWLIPTGRDRAYVASVVAGALSNLAVNLALIPMFGATGAAIGTLVAEIVVCGVQTWEVKSVLPVWKWLIEGLPGLAIGGLMFAFVRLAAPVLEVGAIGLLVEILFGVLVFTLLTSIWCLVSRNVYASEYVIPLAKRFANRVLRKR